MSGIITHEDGVYFGLPEAEHHADPALGSSSIKALLQAPEEYWGSSHLNPMREEPEDTAFFHATLQAACDRHDPAYYPRFKAWADEYFWNRHRQEPRGVGGIFCDDLCTGGAWRAIE